MTKVCRTAALTGVTTSLQIFETLNSGNLSATPPQEILKQGGTPEL
jgi:hypothetical protein